DAARGSPPCHRAPAPANRPRATRLGRRAEAVDRTQRRVTLDDGSALGYDALVLATGSIARRLTVPGHDLTGVHYLKNIADR
ncbi:MAG: pyridine nucleotide-disulfide oxidoreductase, partial [Actinobacteria bacterium]|nr:pyridine nucleotide-disulfide oxidoreductase [Actinomycetota bacterium]